MTVRLLATLICLLGLFGKPALAWQDCWRASAGKLGSTTNMAGGMCPSARQAVALYKGLMEEAATCGAPASVQAEIRQYLESARASEAASCGTQSVSSPSTASSDTAAEATEHDTKYPQGFDGTEDYDFAGWDGAGDISGDHVATTSQFAQDTADEFGLVPGGIALKSEGLPDIDIESVSYDEAKQEFVLAPGGVRFRSPFPLAFLVEVSGAIDADDRVAVSVAADQTTTVIGALNPGLEVIRNLLVLDTILGDVAWPEGGIVENRGLLPVRDLALDPTFSGNRPNLVFSTLIHKGFEVRGGRLVSNGVAFESRFVDMDRTKDAPGGGNLPMDMQPDVFEKYPAQSANMKRFFAAIDTLRDEPAVASSVALAEAVSFARLLQRAGVTLQLGPDGNLETISLADREWAAIKDDADLFELQDFLETHPNASMAEEIQRQISQKKKVANLLGLATGDSEAKLVSIVSGDWVGQVRFSGDGRFAATVKLDAIHIWDVPTGKLRHRLCCAKGAFWAMDFSADGKHVLTGSYSGDVLLWEVSTGKIVRHFKGHKAGIFDVAFSPDGQKIVAGSDDGSARLWDMQTGFLVHRFTGHNGMVLSVAFHPDGSQVLTGGIDETARLWSTETGEEIGRIDANNSIYSVTYSRDGETVFTGGSGGAVWQWNATTGEQIHTNHLYEDSIWKIAVSPDGERYVTADEKGRVFLYDTATNEYVLRFNRHWDRVSGVAFSPDGNTILTGSADGTARLWDAASGKEIRKLGTAAADTWQLTYSPDGRYLVVGSEKLGAQLVDTRTGRFETAFRHDFDKVYYTAFNPSGSVLYTAGYDNSIRAWDLASKQELARYQADYSEDTDVQHPQGIKVSQDGKYLIANFHGLRTILLEAETLRELGHIGVKSSIESLAYSAVTARGAIGSKTGEIGIFDLERRKPSWSPVHDSVITSLEFSPDGRNLVSIADGGTTKMTEVISRKEVWSARSIDTELTSHAIFSPDGETIAVAAKAEDIILRDAASGKEIGRLDGSDFGYTSLAYSPDGKTLAAISDNNVLEFWDVGSGKKRSQMLLMDDGSWLHMTRNGFFDFSAPGGSKILKVQVEIGSKLLTVQEMIKTYHRPERLRRALARR